MPFCFSLLEVDVPSNKDISVEVLLVEFSKDSASLVSFIKSGKYMRLDFMGYTLFEKLL